MSKKQNEDQALEAGDCTADSGGEMPAGLGALPDRFNRPVLSTLRGRATSQFLRTSQRSAT